MKESVIYQEILREGEELGFQKGEECGIQKGLQTGIQTGQQREKIAIAHRMLQSGLNEALIAQVTGLSLAKIQALNS